jgi:hypothetical protein
MVDPWNHYSSIEPFAALFCGSGPPTDAGTD